MATSLSAAASAGPPKTTVSPSSASTASTSAVGLPPARIVSRPAATAGVEPMTGACRYAAPVAVTSASSSAASSGPTVVVFTTVVAGGQRGQARGEHVAAGRGVVQAEQHHVGALDGGGG